MSSASNFSILRPAKNHQGEQIFVSVSLQKYTRFTPKRKRSNPRVIRWMRLHRASLTKVPFYDLQHVHGSVAVHHVDGEAVFAEAPGSADTVQVRLAVSLAVRVDRQVKVDDDRHLFHVYACGEKCHFSFKEIKGAVLASMPRGHPCFWAGRRVVLSTTTMTTVTQKGPTTNRKKGERILLSRVYLSLKVLLQGKKGGGCFFLFFFSFGQSNNDQNRE